MLGKPERILVWDLPVRLFHWLFAAGFLIAYGIAKLLGEHSPVFALHAIIGLTLCMMIVLRVAWGFGGTRWARFSSLHVAPKHQISYFQTLFSPKANPFVGHNPAAGATMLGMFALVAALGLTGYLMGLGNEGGKEVHELFANLMLALAATHVAGVLLHTFVRRDGIVFSLVHGHKTGDRALAAATSAPRAGAAFVAIVGLGFTSLIRSYDPRAGVLDVPISGARLRLTEGGGDRREDGPNLQEGEEPEHRVEREESDE